MNTPLQLATAAFCLALAPQVRGQFIGANFTGSTRNDSGFIPPDTMGAAGVDHFVELINGHYAVYRKTDGVRVQSSTLNAFWLNGGVSISGFSFDPRVLYDPYTRRWFACAVDGPGAANSFLVAVSRSADPTAGWDAFKIDSDADDSNSADFPMMGINGNSVILSAVMFPIGAGSLRNNVVVIPKADLLLETPTVTNKVSFEDNAQPDASSVVYPALDMDGASSLLPLMTSRTPSGIVQRRRAGFAGAATLSTAVSYLVDGFGLPPTADQPGPKANLHTGDTRFSSSPVMNNGEIWAVASTAIVGRAAIQWFRLDANSTTVLEEGTISDPELHLMYPSIAVNDLGDVVIGFGGTGPGTTQFASTYYTAGQTIADTTTFGSIVQTHAGVASYEALDGVGRNRWGDYSATTVDPADPSIFWGAQQFAAAPIANVDQYANRITEIILPQPDESRWKIANGGVFSIGTNWLGGAAPTNSSHVIFSRSTLPVAGGYNVSLLSNQAIDRLSARQGFVTLSLVGQTLTATNGDINQPSLTVGEFGGSPTLLLIGGTFTGTNAAIAPSTFSKGGLILSSVILNLSGSLKIGSAGAITVASSSASVIRAATLDMASGAKILLADSDMIIDYTGASPLGMIQGLIEQGHDGGGWNGEGISSSRAATSPNPGEAGKTALGFGEASAVGITSFNGFAIDSTAVLVKYTYVGDASLNGLVDVVDLGRLAANWQTATHWTGGDFNFSGLVDVDDLGLLAANWQVGVGNPLNPSFSDALAALGLPQVSVPEPAVAGLGLMCIFRRRARR